MKNRSKNSSRNKVENSSANRSANSSVRRLSRAMLAAWKNSTEDDEGTEEEDATSALMAKRDSESDDEPLDSLAYLKDKVCGLNKAKLVELLFNLMDECNSINSENCMLKDACTELKRDIRELEYENKVLKSEKIEIDMKNLVLLKDLNKFKETLSFERRSFCY